MTTTKTDQDPLQKDDKEPVVPTSTDPDEHNSPAKSFAGLKLNIDGQSTMIQPEGMQSENFAVKEVKIQPPPPAEVDFESPLLECLVQLFILLGKPISMERLKAGLPEEGEKGSTSSCLRAAIQSGMNAKVVYRKRLKDISSLTLPCVLLLKNHGACVATSMNNDNVDVIFPEMGKVAISLSVEKLNEEFSGYVIFGRLVGELDKRASEIKLLHTKRWFWGTITHYVPIYKHVVLASLVINMIAIASPLFVMNVYDRVVPNNALETLWMLAIGIFIAYFVDFLLRNLRSYFTDIAGRNADVVMASRLMQHLMSIRLDYKPDSTGTMANNMREFESLREFFSSTTLLAIMDMPFIIIFILIVSMIGGPLFIVPAVAVPFVILCGVLLQFPFQRAVESGYKEGAQKNAILIEILNGIETVKTSMAEGRMQHMWEKVVTMSAKSNAHTKRLANFSMTISMLAAQLVSVGIVVWGVYLITDGSMTMGGLIACNILAGRAMAPLSQVAAMLAKLQQSRMALKSLDQLMNIPSERPAEGSNFDYGDLKSSLSTEELSFKYPQAERFVLEGIHMSIKPGEKVGIIGRMGSGKSTLGKLLVGLYQPTEGAVKFGGVDIRQMDIADLRSKVGYLAQDNYLFYGSVRENISVGLPNADEQAILRAATTAGVIDFIQNHPAGFGMLVGERGMSLSGGQRQAVSLARALLHDPEVLILDEPSSNMDLRSEANLKKRLSTIIEHKMVVIITHRMTMLDLVDRLIIMDNGKILADGPKNVVIQALKEGKLNVAQQPSLGHNRQKTGVAV